MVFIQYFMGKNIFRFVHFVYLKLEEFLVFYIEKKNELN